MCEVRDDAVVLCDKARVQKNTEGAVVRVDSCELPPLMKWSTYDKLERDYRDVAARHHVDCVCAACERAQFEERQQHTRNSMSRDVNEYLDREAERAAEEELDRAPAFTTQYGYIADTDPMRWDDLVAWLVAHPCASNQDLATKLLAAFVMRRVVV